MFRKVTIVGVLSLFYSVSSLAASSDDVNPLANPPSPAFEGQTNAPVADSSAISVEVIVSDLTLPRSLVALPDGNFILANGAGEIRVLNASGELSSPLQGVPEMRTPGGRGFTDITVDYHFTDNRLVYLTYPDVTGEGRITRARLSNDNTQLEERMDIAEILGRRLVSAPDGSLYITMMGYGDNRLEVQDLSTLTGKILRINSDGSIPLDNPFVNQRNARPEIFAVGHRDPDGAMIHPQTEELWTIEHGPMGGDELNSIQAGENNGWPAISYGKNYDGTEIGGSLGAGLQQPLYYWFPSVAPSGLMMYSGDAFPAWQGDLFLGTMSPTQGKFLIRLKMDGDSVASEEHLLVDHDRRVRAVTQGIDGLVYVLTDSENNEQTNRHFTGEVLRLSPR